MLRFAQPARTSCAVLTERPVWYLTVSHPDAGWTGVGECAPLDGLSIEALADIEPMLETLRENPALLCDLEHPRLRAFPSVMFAIETALLHYGAGGGTVILPGNFTERRRRIPINGLIWMGDFSSMKEQIDRKLADGYHCLKLKIGGLAFEDELALLRHIRSRYAAADLTLRLDANGAFPPDKAADLLGALSQFSIHSIEQPIKAGQIEALARLCRTSPIPIALDEELIGAAASGSVAELLDRTMPAYVVLKPSLLGGFWMCSSVIARAKERGIGFWITSALESNVALNYIAQWSATVCDPRAIQGLGTGLLYSNNTQSLLSMSRGELTFTGRT